MNERSQPDVTLARRRKSDNFCEYHQARKILAGKKFYLERLLLRLEQGLGNGNLAPYTRSPSHFAPYSPPPVISSSSLSSCASPAPPLINTQVITHIPTPSQLPQEPETIAPIDVPSCESSSLISASPISNSTLSCIDLTLDSTSPKSSHDTYSDVSSEYYERSSQSTEDCEFESVNDKTYCEQCDANHAGYPYEHPSEGNADGYDPPKHRTRVLGHDPPESPLNCDADVITSETFSEEEEAEREYSSQEERVSGYDPPEPPYDDPETCYEHDQGDYEERGNTPESWSDNGSERSQEFGEHSY